MSTKFGFELTHLTPFHGEVPELRRTVAALLTSFAAHRDIRYAFQLVASPDPLTGGRIDASVLARGDLDPATDQRRIVELVDDIDDVLGNSGVGWAFRIVQGEDAAPAFNPVEGLAHFAELLRPEQVGAPITTSRRTSSVMDDGTGTGGLWTTWQFGPSPDFDDHLANVLLAQEAPVVIRTLISSSELTVAEREHLGDLGLSTTGSVADTGPIRASLRTIEALLYTRPLLRCHLLIASPEPISPSLLSTIGWTVSPPIENPDPYAPILKGGFAVDLTSEERLEDVRSVFDLGDPNTLATETLAPSQLSRLRHLMGAWEASNIVRLPVLDKQGFPGLEGVSIPVTNTPTVASKSAILIGHSLGPGTSVDVGLDPQDRMRHLYLVGQTGTGKSTVIQNLILADIGRGDGVALIDPHGDLVESILDRIPEERLDDVVLIDPADNEAVVGVNLIEAESAQQQQYLVSTLSEMFYDLFDPAHQGIVGPRYETWLRNAVLLLLESGHPASLLDVTTVYTDNKVRAALTKNLANPMMREFWLGEISQMTDYHKSEMLGWFRSKFEVFRTSALVRRVVGQAESSVNFSEVLSERRILLVNLSKGLLGEYDSRLIGYVVMSKLWAATLARARISAGARTPFHLYVDEFQNVTGDSLPEMLAEARKFQVSITLANQFFTQVPENTRAAIMGNVASRLSFRLGALDAPAFARWLGDDINDRDLTQLPNFVAVASLTRDGVPQPPVTIRTQSPRAASSQMADRARQRSRDQWAQPVGRIDEDFEHRWDDIRNPRHNQSSESRPSADGDRTVDAWLGRRVQRLADKSQQSSDQ